MRIAFAFAALFLAACSSQSTTETRQVTENTPQDGRRRSEVHTALAGEYYQRGNYTVALAETRAAIKDDPTYVGAHNMQALVFMELKEDGPARESFAIALKLSPNNPEVLNNYGWFLCLRNDPTRGLELMRRASTVICIIICSARICVSFAVRLAPDVCPDIRSDDATSLSAAAISNSTRPIVVGSFCGGASHAVPSLSGPMGASTSTNCPGLMAIFPRWPFICFEMNPPLALRSVTPSMCWLMSVLIALTRPIKKSPRPRP
jgi:hypothetical protein